MHKSILVALALTAAALSVPAHAADNGIYAGASLGQSGVNFDQRIEGTNLHYAADATGFKLIAGWRALDWLALEGNYVDLGSGSDRIAGEKVKTDINGTTLSALGFLPLGPVDVFARIGAVNWNADVRIPSLSTRASDNGTDFTYGIGAQFRLGSLSLRAEYERFDVSDIDTVDLASLGVTWTFF
jgi:opacity protein-like surface antigen